ncbi:MAG: protein kinase [Sandaracinaceae bacterium]
MLGPSDIVAGRYRVVRLLSQGGMGAVYEAEQLGLGRRVVLKTVLATAGQKAQLSERLLREAHAASAIQHPNVVTVHDIVPLDDGAAIAMEWIEGPTLLDVLRDRGVIPEGEARAWMAQILAGLAAAHAQGVVHRDLKPSNLILTRAPGVGSLVKILDFGIARFVDQERSARLTDTGQLLGTPGYMAPEQVEGREVDARTDVFAAGVILYRMLAARLPWDGAGAEQLVAMMERAPRPLASVRPDLPPDLTGLVHRAIEREPGLRFASAIDMSEALSRAAVPGGRATSSQHGSLRWVILAVGLGTLALVAGVAIVIGLGAGDAPSVDEPAVARAPTVVSDAGTDLARSPLVPMEPVPTGLAEPDEAGAPAPTRRPQIDEPSPDRGPHPPRWARARHTVAAAGPPDPRLEFVNHSDSSFGMDATRRLYASGQRALARCLDEVGTGDAQFYVTLQLDGDGRVIDTDVSTRDIHVGPCVRSAYLGHSLAGSTPGYVGASARWRRHVGER